MSSLSLSLNDQADSDSDEIPNDTGDPDHRRSYEISSESNEYEAQNGSVNNQRVPLPRKRKACFFLSYFSFLILYLAFLLVTAFTYPLKPVCNISHIIPLDGAKTENESFNLVLEFINRNPLISVSYDSFLNISVYYISSSNVSYFAETTAPGFDQQNLKQTEVTVHIPAPESSQLSEMQNTSNPIGLLVNLDFIVGFRCISCKEKRRMTFNVTYYF